MRTCMQFGTLSVLAHGAQVTEAFDHLKQALQLGVQPADWRIPGWLLDNPAPFLQRLFSAEVLYAYQLYHDCGKPVCRTIDADGRVHFPNHATHSEARWLSHGGDLQVGRLIGLDMAMHLATAEAIPDLAKLPEAASLYLTAIAEVHANAAMFGGFASASFLAKAKHLDRRGRALLRHWH